MEPDNGGSTRKTGAFVALLPSPPRRVRLRKGRFPAGACGYVLLIPHLCAGVFLLWQFFMTLLIPLGVYHPGEVTARQVEHRRKGDHYLVRVRSLAPERPGSRRFRVEQSFYEQVSEGSRVRLLNPPAVTGRGTILLESFWTVPREIGMMAGIALFWNGVLVLVTWPGIGQPLLNRWLTIHGRAETGVISEKREQRGSKTAWHSVAFEFPRIDGQPYHSEVRIRQKDWQAAETGDRVTVLYADGRPWLCTLYSFGDWEVREGL